MEQRKISSHRTNIQKTTLFDKNRFGKRRQVSRTECLFDLQATLLKMFKSYNKGVKNYNEILGSFFTPNSIGRADGAILNSCIVGALQSEFPNNWRFGKYKRFILNINGYLILVKKLNSKDKPMNIKTKRVNSINNQYALKLFDNEKDFLEPILFFGYKKNRQGEVYSPQLVYIDENQVKWIITENEISKFDSLGGNIQRNEGNDDDTIRLKLKDKSKRRRSSNDDIN